MLNKNGFVMYIESRRFEFQNAGHKLEGGLPVELVRLCSKDWVQLPLEQKEKFTRDAKRYNDWVVKVGEGLSSSPRSRLDQFMEELSERCLMKVKPDGPHKFSGEDSMLFHANRGILRELFETHKIEWTNQPIVICSFTQYVEPGSDLVYLPAEIGLTAVTLKDGIIDNFARIIDPGSIPLVYGMEEIRMNAKKLGLPPLGKTLELADYKPLMTTLENFLQAHTGNMKGESHYVFAFDSDFLTVKKCLEWLFEKAECQIRVRILSLDQFGYLASMNSSVSQEMMKRGATLKTFVWPESNYRRPGKSLTGSFIYSTDYPTCASGLFVKEEDVEKCIKDTDNYKYLKELSCVYHVKSGKEIHNCALNMSNRYAFNFLEILTLSWNVPPVPGGHYPEVDKPEAERDRRYCMLAKWGITSMEDELEESDVIRPFVM